MTKWDIPEWNDWDNAARAELTDEFDPFGYSQGSKAALFRVYRGTVEVGWGHALPDAGGVAGGNLQDHVV
ncbi:hypothetical protein LRS71_24465 [Rhodococcus pyridinivorans]|uniref:hypothetical protein n=1 Tax=Rhodococcus pyridinivorans TaxID=103816 RepID=UPI001E5B2B9B|nr:hypothetical protein [Rhodococcus pyridinivorans]MCD5422668.1 hypothetical protein [Rhodococcus pyridinivorans]